MSDEKRSSRIASAEELLSRAEAARICKVRYGRARLSIARWRRLADGPVATALAAWQAGETSPREVAWAFVRDRIEDHTPSFSWEEADLDRLVVLVAECASDPEFTSRRPEDLAAELEHHREREERHRREADKALQARVTPMIPQLPKPLWDAIELRRQIDEQLRSHPGIERLERHLSGVLADRERIDREFRPLIKRLFEARPTIELLAGWQAETAAAANEYLKSAALQSFLTNDALRSLRDAVEFADLRQLAADAADLARDAQLQGTADALTDTAEVLGEVDANPSVDVIQEAMEHLVAEIKASLPNPYLMAVVAVLLSYLLQMLSAYFGLPPQR